MRRFSKLESEKIEFTSRNSAGLPIPVYHKINMASHKSNPAKLGHLATEKLTNVLQISVANMNRIIASDIKKQFANPPPPPSSPDKDQGSAKPSSSTLSPKAANKMTCAKAAIQMMVVRKYLMTGMTNPITTKMTLTPKVVQQIISIAISSKNIGLIRLILCDWISILDFRALDIHPSRFCSHFILS